MTAEAKTSCCPTCGSPDPGFLKSNCYNAWHRDTRAHGGRASESEPVQVARLPELSDEDVARATLDDLRAAYRSLRDHHVAETTALISRRDDITRARDEMLAKSAAQCAELQKLVDRAELIMRRDEETIERLGEENARLAEVFDFMQNRYSPIGGRACALCVYLGGRFIRPCAVHRWDDNLGAKVLAPRAADLEDLTTTDNLSDDELREWAARAGIYEEAMGGSYLRLVVDELRERRDAEVLFVELDRKFQDIVDCGGCAEGGPDGCRDHAPLIRSWRDARSALCDLARIHRGYLMSLNAPGGGDPA